MSLLPIFERELRVAARRPATHRLRLFLPLLVLALWFFLLITAQNSTPVAQQSKTLFAALSTFAMLFCLLAGIFLTADCLSSEKREGTLGLLFLTELRGYDVVIGKLAATSLHAIYGLIAILPVLALPLLMGGVSVGEFWRMSLALATTLFLSLAIGLIVSSVSEVTRKATVGTLLVILLLSGFLPMLYWFFKLFVRGPLGTFILWWNPPFLFAHAFDNFYQVSAGKQEFWVSCVCLNLLTVAALAGSSFLVTRLWRRDASPRFAPRVPTQPSVAESPRQSRAARGPVLDLNPYYWLARHERSPARTALAFSGFLLPIWLCFWAACFSNLRGARDIGFSVAILLGFGMHQVLKFLMATEASRRFNDDYHSGAMEILLITPLSTSQIIAGQRRALKEIFLLPALLTLFTNLALYWLLIATDKMGIADEELVVFSEVLIAGGFLLLTDYYALSWVGMSLAFTSRGHPRVIFETFAKVMFLPWLGLMLQVFSGMGGRGLTSGQMKVFFSFWILASMMLDIVLAARAKARLSRQFRKSSEDMRTDWRQTTRAPARSTLSLGNA